MFYSQQVLTKKGPLAKIWLAAHMQSKLTKAMVFATDLRKAVDSILSPDAPMALRLTSNLLLGVARILHRKTKYLLQESSDALMKLKLTFRSNFSVDLPPVVTNFSSVTLADATVDGLAAPMVDLSLIPSVPKKAGDSSAFLAADRDITIDEFAGGLAGGMLDAFALEPDLDRDAELSGESNEPLLFTPSQRPGEERGGLSKGSVKEASLSVEITRAEDSGKVIDVPVLSVEKEMGDNTGERDEDVDMEQSVDTNVKALANNNAEVAQQNDVDMGDKNEDVDVGRAVTDVGGGTEVPDIGTPPKIGSPARLETVGENDAVVEEQSGEGAEAGGIEAEAGEDADTGVLGIGEEENMGAVPRLSSGTDFELVEEEVAAEEVAEAGSITEAEARTEAETEEMQVGKRGRKRKAVFIEDEATELSVEEFRACLNDTSDLVLGVNERRKGGGGGGKRVEFEDILKRPGLSMNEEMRRVFEMGFEIREAEVGSPMSDGGDGVVVGNEVERVEEVAARTMEKEEMGSQMGDKEDSLTLGAVEGGNEDVVKDGEKQEDSEKEAEEGVATEKTTEIVEKVVSIDPGIRSPTPPQEEDWVQQTGEEASGGDVAGGFEWDVNNNKVSLKDVANTRSEVEQDKADGKEGVDVTESTISSRTRKMQDYLVEHLSGGAGGEVDYSEGLKFEKEVTRRTAARSFYELLNLGSKKAIKLKQDGAYGRITVKLVQPTFDQLHFSN